MRIRLRNGCALSRIFGTYDEHGRWRTCEVPPSRTVVAPWAGSVIGVLHNGEWHRAPAGWWWPAHDETD